MPSLAFAAAAVDSNPTKTDSLDSAHSFRITTATTTNNRANWVQEHYKDEVVEFTPATCTKDGSITLKCYRDANQELCTETKTFVVKASHDYSDKRLSVEAYAKAMQAAKVAGFKNDAQVARQIATIGETYCYVEAPVCKACGAIDANNAAIAAVGVNHERTTTNQGADCKSTTPCVNCSKELTKTSSRAKHSYESAVGTIDSNAVPTSEKKLCKNSDGKDVYEKTYTCTACNETAVDYVAESGSKVPACKVFKNPIDVVVDGSNVYKKGTSTLVDNGTTVQPGFKKSLGTYYEADTAVKSAVDGKTYLAFTCNECGYVTVTTVEKTDVASAAHVHTWTKVTSDPTCVLPGYQAAYCEGCGMYAKTDNLTSKTFVGSLYDNIVSVDEAIAAKPALGHTLEVKKVEATCAVPGHYEISCSVCGNDYGKKSYEKTYVQFVSDPAKASLFLKSTGRVTASGAYGDIELPYIDPAVKNHSFTKKVVLKEATCDVNELSGFKCDVCGKMNVHNVTETAGTALGHKPEKVNVVNATCGSAGWYNVQCSVCKKYATNKAQTTWNANIDSSFDFEGDAPVVGKYTKCSYDKWVVAKEATVFEEGVKSLVCSVCGDEQGSKDSIAKKTVAKASNTVKAGKKSFNVKSSAANATGYRVYYKKAGAKSWKSYTKKTDSLSKTFSKLSKGKYYVKVKAYAKNYAGDGEVVWGEVSSTKTVKVK